MDYDGINQATVRRMEKGEKHEIWRKNQVTTEEFGNDPTSIGSRVGRVIKGGSILGMGRADAATGQDGKISRTVRFERPSVVFR